MSEVDTIFALSSGPAPSAIAVIRLSGAQAISVVETLVCGVLAPQRPALKRLIDPFTGDVIDQALILVFKAPASFTGEDVAEIHCHGSGAVISYICETLARFSGLRFAEPGEFTRRAFFNQKMDLLEVEGLADLLQAETRLQQKLAVRHYLGEASSVYQAWRKDILAVLGRVEAAIDFIDDGDIAAEALADIEPRITHLIQDLRHALLGVVRAGSLRDGVRVVIVGAPNVGKSSLLNRIAAREAAIVSALPGTTRDVIEVKLNLAGIPVLLTDTAGLRDATQDVIEQMGIERSYQQLALADLIILVSDQPKFMTFSETVSADFYVLNKIDLYKEKPIHTQNEQILSYEISTKTGEGITAFIAGLTELVQEKYAGSAYAVVIRERQRLAVEKSIRHLNDSLLYPFTQLELTAEALRKAALALAEVIGQVGVEDLLGQIFQEFCVGK